MAVRRRLQAQRTAQQLFDEVLQSPIDWPGRTIRLERDSLLDFRGRSGSAQVAISELYHENSKLFARMLGELRATSAPANEIRREFVRRRSVIAQSTGEPMQLDQRCRRVLGAVATTTAPELFYALELRVIDGENMGELEPVSDWLRVVKRLDPEDLDGLRRAVLPMSNRSADQTLGPLLAILGAFARNELLLGVRGYRRTLIEAGQVAQAVVQQAEQLGVPLDVRYEFIDRGLDRAMEADGVELGTVVILEFGGTRDAVVRLA